MPVNYIRLLVACVVITGCKTLMPAQVRLEHAHKLAQAKYELGKELFRQTRVQPTREIIQTDLWAKSRDVLLYTGAGVLGLLVVAAFIAHADQLTAGKAIHKVTKPTKKFTDVAGVTAAKQEFMMIVDFLENPGKYTQLGARLPRGVLLSGPPGNGKTLLAQAVAGEAGCSFFEAKGSEFVETYVGVGAARIRKLFAQARKHAPSIIFIDEIESVGAKRHGGGDQRESDNTLNQLLAEMDGFATRDFPVIIIGATNAKDKLDKAFVRPGRFDVSIEVALPTQEERAEILEIHAKNKPLGHDVSLQEIAQKTVGFSGAALENLLNRAAIRAVQHNKAQTEQQECDEILEEILKSNAEPKRQRAEPIPQFQVIFNPHNINQQRQDVHV